MFENVGKVLPVEGLQVQMKHTKLITQLPKHAEGIIGGSPFEVKVQFVVQLVDRAVVWGFQKDGASL